MAKKEAKIKYGEYNVCRADFERLHQLDSDAAKLKHRADLAIKTLSNLDFNDTKNIALTQRYIDSTYPNSLKRIDEKRNEILKAYKKQIYIPEKLIQTLFIIAFVSIAIAVIIFSIISIKNAAGI